MGVPGYFARAIKDAPDAVQARPVVGVRRLLLDFNSAVHRGVDSRSTTDSVIEHACEVLDAVLDAARPSEEVFVAIDGVAPLAKVGQQRARRYLAHKRRCVVGGRATAFDRNCITPGTEFMRELDARLGARLEEVAAERGIRAVFSGSSVPGEGEHKIMSHIRASPLGGGDCVYGLDADLIILCMVLFAQTGEAPQIVREEGYNLGESEVDTYAFLDVARLIGEVARKGAPGQTREERVRNHVVASFLVGNDFLPPLSCLSVKQGSLEWLARAAPRALCSPDWCLDWGAVLETVAKVAAREDAWFRDRDLRYWSARPPLATTVEEAWDSLPLTRRCDRARRIRPGAPGWRPRYYATLLGTDDVGGVAATFLLGVQWTLDYYGGAFGSGASGVPEWNFPHAYGPTALDLQQHMETRDPVDLRARLRELPVYDFSAARALLMVTPPSSFDILPERLRAAAEDVGAGLAHFFPDDFEVETYLHRWVHECRPRVPPVDVLSFARAGV